MCRLGILTAGWTWQDMEDLLGHLYLKTNDGLGIGSNKFLFKGANLKLDDIKIQLSVRLQEPVLFHLRQASIGAKGDENCHPFQTTSWTVMQNGSFRDHMALRWMMALMGHKFEGESDAETLAHLVQHMGRSVFFDSPWMLDEFGVVVAMNRDGEIFINKGIGYSIEYAKIDGTLYFGTSLPSLWKQSVDVKELLPHSTVKIDPFKMKFRILRGGVDDADRYGSGVYRYSDGSTWNPYAKTVKTTKKSKKSKRSRRRSRDIKSYSRFKVKEMEEEEEEQLSDAEWLEQHGLDWQSLDILNASVGGRGE